MTEWYSLDRRGSFVRAISSPLPVYLRKPGTLARIAEVDRERQSITADQRRRRARVAANINPVPKRIRLAGSGLATAALSAKVARTLSLDVDLGTVIRLIPTFGDSDSTLAGPPGAPPT